MSNDCIAKSIFPVFQCKIQNILYITNNNQLIQNNFSKLFSGKWTVLSINIMEKKCGMEIKFMSNDCIAKTIFPGYQWKFQNILYFKKNNQLIQYNFSKLFSGKWAVLGINIVKKKCGMEIKFMSNDCIAKTIFHGYQWKFQNILYIKNNNQLMQNKFSNLFSGKWTVLSLDIMEKKIWNGD